MDRTERKALARSLTGECARGSADRCDTDPQRLYCETCISTQYYLEQFDNIHREALVLAVYTICRGCEASDHQCTGNRCQAKRLRVLLLEEGFRDVL